MDSKVSKPSDLPEVLTFAGEKYVMVNATAGAQPAAGAGKDAKAQVVKAPHLTVGVKKALGKGKGGQYVGLKPLRLRMPYSFTMSCAVGGVAATNLAVMADANAAEWAGVLALYDEYRVMGGLVKFGMTYQAPAGSTSVDAIFCALGYDPVDGSNPTGVRSVCELSQHVLLAAQSTSVVTNSTAVAQSFGCANSKPHTLRWRTPPVQNMAITSTGTLAASAGQWKKMNNSTTNNPDGYLKFYGVSDFAAIAAVVVGIVYLDVEFRSRA